MAVRVDSCSSWFLAARLVTNIPGGGRRRGVGRERKKRSEGGRRSRKEGEGGRWRGGGRKKWERRKMRGKM